LPSESQWQAEVWGDETLDVHQKEDQLLAKMKADIEHKLQSHQAFEPLYIEVDDEDITYLDYSGWCHGFMYGLSLLELDWQTMNDAIKDLIAPISKLALSDDEDDENDLSDEEFAEMVEMIPGSVAALYQNWHQ
jgi:yecA family protein